MGSDKPQAWEELYAAAVLETDPSKIENCIDQAQDALRERWHTLEQTPLVHDREKRRIEDALRTLNMIRVTELRTSA